MNREDITWGVEKAFSDTVYPGDKRIPDFWWEDNEAPANRLYGSMTDQVADLSDRLMSIAADEGLVAYDQQPTEPSRTTHWLLQYCPDRNWKSLVAQLERGDEQPSIALTNFARVYLASLSAEALYYFLPAFAVHVTHPFVDGGFRKAVIERLTPIGLLGDWGIDRLSIAQRAAVAKAFVYTRTNFQDYVRDIDPVRWWSQWISESDAAVAAPDMETLNEYISNHNAYGDPCFPASFAPKALREMVFDAFRDVLFPGEDRMFMTGRNPIVPEEFLDLCPEFDWKLLLARIESADVFHRSDVLADMTPEAALFFLPAYLVISTFDEGTELVLDLPLLLNVGKCSGYAESGRLAELMSPRQRSAVGVVLGYFMLRKTMKQDKLIDWWLPWLDQEHASSE